MASPPIHLIMKPESLMLPPAFDPRIHSIGRKLFANSVRVGFSAYLPLDPWCLEQCLTHGRCLINIC